MFAPTILLVLLVTSLSQQCHSADDYSSLQPPCDSPIFCYGDLLETVQLAGIFADSKTFVDRKLKMDVNETLAAFNIATFNDKNDVENFINEYFEEADAVEETVLVDFKRNQSFIENVCNVTVQAFVRELVDIWPDLARKVKKEVYDNPDLYSFIPVPNNFIIPGGRFREYYYWDSYWVIEGLLISEMYETARGMIENFFHLVETIGLIPNGGRVYYLRRSQPPLLASMVSLYYKYTGDVEWVSKHLDVVAKELTYWLQNKTTTIQTSTGNYTLARYIAPTSGPRPESYAEDVETAETWDTEEQRQKTYVELKGGAESGWDFSSRWIFDENGGTEGNLTHIETSRVIPVDLNSFLCHGFKTVAELYKIVGKNVDSSLWTGIYNDWVEAVNSVLWNSEGNIWLDYDAQLNRHRTGAYPTHVAPLWAGCHDPNLKTDLVQKANNYLANSGILAYLGGLPTSVKDTEQQWDFPNAWAPLQHLVVYALAGAGVEDADKAASELVSRWINSNILGYIESGEMFEKYDAKIPGEYGGGGEYTVQSGFGWTNGVAFKFIYDYYQCK